jgi:alpha/beta superfamily hydrolase
VKLVGETVRSENATKPNSPIYLIGESFGGSLALAVAACNPHIDLVLILANPGEKSFLCKSQFLLEPLPLNFVVLQFNWILCSYMCQKFPAATSATLV